MSGDITMMTDMHANPQAIRMPERIIDLARALWRGYQVSRLVSAMRGMSDAQLSRIGIRRSGIRERAEAIVNGRA